MKTVKLLVLIGTTALLNVAVGSAEDTYLRADHKLRALETRTYQQHAQDRAQTLYYYSQTQQPVPKPEAKDLVAGIRKDLAASEKALAALKAELAKDKDAIELVESIKKHHAKARDLCGMAEEACAKEEGDKVVIGDCCSEMWYELDAAKADTQKLLKSLKLDKLEPPKKVEAKDAPKKDGAKKEGSKK